MKYESLYWVTEIGYVEVNIKNRGVKKDMSQFDWKKLREYSAKHWPEWMGTTHDVEHWDRVAKFGRLLFKEGADIDVIMPFAFLHNSERENNVYDEEHGLRASKQIDIIRETELKNLNDRQIAKLKRACELHTIKHRTGDMTVDICFGADRMDLLRIGIMPSPERITTKQGTDFVSDPYKYLEFYNG